MTTKTLFPLIVTNKLTQKYSEFSSEYTAQHFDPDTKRYIGNPQKVVSCFDTDIWSIIKPEEPSTSLPSIPIQSTINKYMKPIPQRSISNNGIDVYDIDTMFPMANSALLHGRKKLFKNSERSEIKSQIQDIEEAITSLKIGLEILIDTEESFSA